MKPHRIRMTHDLVTAYDMLDKMHVLVRSAFSVIQLKTLRTLRTLLQRPSRTSPETMTSFHTDEYIHFLNRVTPETAEELTYHGTRCEFVDVQFLRVSFFTRETQFWLETTIPRLRAYLNSVRYQREGPSVGIFDYVLSLVVI